MRAAFQLRSQCREETTFTSVGKVASSQSPMDHGRSGRRLLQHAEAGQRLAEVSSAQLTSEGLDINRETWL